MDVIKEQLEAMLRQHLKNESKLTEVKLKEEEYQTRLDYAGLVHEEEEDEIIENMQLAGQGYDSIHSNTNKISDKVSSTALNYEKELIHINKEDRTYLENKIQECKSEEDRLNKAIVRIENVLQPLSVEEKFVIKQFYFYKAKWDYIEKEYFNEFEKHKTIKQLQTYRDTALETMLDILN